MARSVEILITGQEAKIGEAVLRESAAAATELGLIVTVSQRYQGGSDWLALWGVGEASRDAARWAQIKAGGYAALWDIGYTNEPGRGKEPGVSYIRVSVNQNHPWRFLDRTPNDVSRFNQLGIALREDARANGPVIVIGMGPKSRTHLGLDDWEITTLSKAKVRFPERRVLYRPKPRRVMDTHINWPLSEGGEIADALRGASLVICRHSNVAVDACIAGVPVECEDGAAFWMYRHGADPGEATRLDFLRRLAYWQWRTDEQKEAWTFLQMICA